MEQRLIQHQNDILKITVFGPESTGKTTLCKQLATHFKTNWIPEFARDYLQKKWDTTKQTCDPSDLLPIAYGQIALENEGQCLSNKILFCDTNLLLTKVFSETNYGFCDERIHKAALTHQYDLFFLTDIDIPWQADSLRDRPDGRKETFEYFKKTLIDDKRPFIILSGNENLRFTSAVSAINELIQVRQLGFNSIDFVHIYNHGISASKIKQQLSFFKQGIQKLHLLNAASIGHGINRYSKTELDSFVEVFDERKNHISIQNFVPASGAASRMFKFLTEFINEFDLENDTINAYIDRKKAKDLSLFLVGLAKFPFYNIIINSLKTNPDYELWQQDKHHYQFIKSLLYEFDYANKPKGVLPFFNVNNKIITATEQHLIENGHYGISGTTAKLHLTISKEHQQDFEEIIASKKKSIEHKFLCQIEITFSYQQKQTDTIAVDFQNNVFRDKNNEIVFRPGGHGALIENLNNLNTSLIFIKNIDNVSINNIEEIVFYKKSLAGILITIQNQIFAYLKILDLKPADTIVDEIAEFVTKKCCLFLDSSYQEMELEIKIKHLKHQLNRPIRVCGMVKNEGEPGGGPFWVLNHDNKVSLQIVESSQIDLTKIEQKDILQESTHFNPVDLVCGTQNYLGNKFDLSEFVDKNGGFIVHKNKNGYDLQGYELPGLWNGAMADWITIFVEVPLSTFNPVKTVNDLLKPSHQ